MFMSDDLIVQRFVLKLLVSLVSSIPECKKKFLREDKVFDELTNIFMNSSDDVLLEFSAILLLHILDDPKKFDSLGRDETFLKRIFDRFKSNDVDILLQSMQLLNILMKNSMLNQRIFMHKDFPIRNLQIELKNEIPEIQSAALESFFEITNSVENPFWNVLSSERLVEAIFELCMVRLH